MATKQPTKKRIPSHARPLKRLPNVAAPATATDILPEAINTLNRIAERVRRANAIQHSGGKITAEDWSELYDLQNEAFGVVERYEARVG